MCFFHEEIAAERLKSMSLNDDDTRAMLIKVRCLESSIGNRFDNHQIVGRQSANNGGYNHFQGYVPTGDHCLSFPTFCFHREMCCLPSLSHVRPSKIDRPS